METKKNYNYKQFHFAVKEKVAASIKEAANEMDMPVVQYFRYLHNQHIKNQKISS